MIRNRPTRWRLTALSLLLGMALGLASTARAGDKLSAPTAHPAHKHASSRSASTSAPAAQARQGSKALSKTKASKKAHGKKSRAEHVQTGTASWYGKQFHGRRTANGERFDKFSLTAAHRSIPFGTWVEVRSLRNGRTVKVRINDRGPFVRGRIIDLSRGSAEKLGIHGIGRVELRWPVTPPKMKTTRAGKTTKNHRKTHPKR